MSTQQKMENLNVTVLNSKPPVFEHCESVFGIKWENTIFAYDPHIHASHELTDDVLEHEMVHIKQQRDYGGVEKWWDEYFINGTQRLEWELEAYKRQYQFLKKRNTYNKQQMFDLVSFWADNLSGRSYGYLISKTDAIKEIMT